jgi:hypothetical protein
LMRPLVKIVPFTHSRAFGIMEDMGTKLDQQLLQASARSRSADGLLRGAIIGPAFARTRWLAMTATAWRLAQEPQTVPPHTPPRRRPASAAT